LNAHKKGVGGPAEVRLNGADPAPLGHPRDGFFASPLDRPSSSSKVAARPFNSAARLPVS